MIDLEKLGKAKRQCGRQLFLSDHYPSDIDRLRATLFSREHSGAGEFVESAKHFWK